MVQKMTFTSSMRNSNSSSVQPSLKSSPSSRPILFGTSKDLKLSPLRPSATKHSHDAIEEMRMAPKFHLLLSGKNAQQILLIHYLPLLRSLQHSPNLLFLKIK